VGVGWVGWGGVWARQLVVFGVVRGGGGGCLGWVVLVVVWLAFSCLCRGVVGRRGGGFWRGGYVCVG